MATSSLVRRSRAGARSPSGGLDPFVRASVGPGFPSGVRLSGNLRSVLLSVSSPRPREIVLRFRPGRGTGRRSSTTPRDRSVRFGPLRVHLGSDPPSLEVLEGDEVLFETATELPPGKLPGPPPWSSTPRGLRLPLRFASEERVYGAGEYFGPLDHAGHELRVSVRDVFGLPNDATYVTYPFYWSTRGYAFLAETWSPVRFDFGRQYAGLGEVELPEIPVVVRLFFSKSPREILRWFWDRRGEPAVPPLWSYGIWYSRCSYRSQAELLRVARRIRSLGLPGDVIHLDPPWLDEPLPDALYEAGRKLGFSRRAVDRLADRDPGDVLAGLSEVAARHGISLPFFGVGCTFRWNRRRFPEPVRMIRELGERGLRLSLWINPYVPAHTPEFEFLQSRGLFVRRSNGRVGLDFDHPSVDFGAVDLTNPEGRDWFAERVGELIRLGVGVIKTDFGEAIPERARAHAGGETELHNRYATLYPETVFRAVRDAGGDPMVWGRSGGLDIHRYPVQWGGDPRTFPRDMGAALRGALSYAASGGAFMAFDSGGFGGRPTPELYVRWVQMGLLFSHCRLHGTTPREPWTFGARALRIFRKYAALRYRLIPYLYSQSIEGLRLGRPLVRPIVLDAPRDPAASSEDEYLLGESLLVAPVLPASRPPPVVLPRGEWFDFWSGKPVPEGGSVSRRVGLDRIPVFAKAGSAIAMTEQDYDRVDPEMLRTLRIRTFGKARTLSLDFGKYGRLRIADLQRRRSGRSGLFRWTVEPMSR